MRQNALSSDELQKLIDEKTRMLFSTFKLKRSAMFDFKRSSKNLLSYCQRLNQPFSSLTGYQWLATYDALHQGTATEQRKYRSYQRCLGILLDDDPKDFRVWKSYRMLANNQLKHFHDKSYLLLYLDELKKEGRAEATLAFSKRVIVLFMEYLEQISCLSFRSLTPLIVKQFFFLDKMKHRKPKGLQAYAYRLRLFLRFLVDKGVIAPHFAMTVSTSYPGCTGIISCLSQKDMSRLLAMNHTPPSLRKRNYAMLLLALHLGLRSSDIIHLCLHHIHWKQEKISMVQQKTQKFLDLPLLPEVGNALAEYILHHRPQSSSPYVFLRSSAPYTRLTKSSCYQAITYQLWREKGKNNTENKPFGFHILRRTRASQLLESGSPPSLITSFLGHTQLQSIDPYLAIDSLRLRSCALPMGDLSAILERIP